MTKTQTIILTTLALLVGAGLTTWYFIWRQGEVIAVDKSGTLKIRQIPYQFPGLNDSYAYRCEVWDQSGLCKATTLRYVDFSAELDKCSITIVSATKAIFHIDGYDIKCTNYGMGDDTHSTSSWKRLNQ